MNFGDIYALVLKEYPDILTVDEMSKALGVSTKTGYQLLRENKIEHLKVGRAYKVAILLKLILIHSNGTEKSI